MRGAIDLYRRRLIDAGAVRVFVLPYPYARGHFRVRDEYGQERFLFMEDDFLRESALACEGFSGSADLEAFLRAQTYRTLLLPHKAKPMAMDDDLRLLIRLCMDAGRPLAAQRALKLLGQIYPRYCASETLGDLLFVCADFLCGFFSQISQEKCAIRAKTD